MASKKPAKPIAGQSKVQQTLDPSIYGVLVRYVGTKGFPVICGYCKRSSIRGMIRIKGEDRFCSVGCAEQSFKIGQVDSGENTNEPEPTI